MVGHEDRQYLLIIRRLIARMRCSDMRWKASKTDERHNCTTFSRPDYVKVIETRRHLTQNVGYQVSIRL